MTKGHAKGSSDLSMQQVRCSLTGKQCSWLVWWCCFIWSHRNNSHLPCRKPDRIENGERTRSRHTRRDGKSLTLSKRKESCKQTTNNGNGERKEPFKLWEQKSQQVCLRPAKNPRWLFSVVLLLPTSSSFASSTVLRSTNACTQESSPQGDQCSSDQEAEQQLLCSHPSLLMQLGGAWSTLCLHTSLDPSQLSHLRNALALAVLLKLGCNPDGSWWDGKRLLDM